MGKQSTDFFDAVQGALNFRPLGKNFEYLSSPTQPRPWILMPKLFGQGKGKRWVAQGGSQIEVDVVTQDGGTAAFVFPDQTYQLTSRDFMAKATMPWRHANANYTVNREEVRICRGTEKLLDTVIAPKRLATQMNMATVIETELFAPSDGTSSLNPLTIPYWVVPIATGQVAATGTGAFQGAGTVYGTAPTSVGGLSTTTYTRWKNYNAVRATSDGSWTDADNDRFCWMFDSMSVTMPPNVDMLKDTPFDMLQVLTDRTTKTSLERRATQQNDNVGPDVAKYHGGTYIKNIPITWVSALDTASASARGTYPLYLLNWAYGAPVVREGNIFREEAFEGTGEVPNLTVVHIDLSYNLVVTNRPLFGGVISYVA